MSTRLIERWFPCEEVSEQSSRGWGSGFAERSLFTWFASRPLAQAKAAVICSLLPWPGDPTEQERLKRLVREAMTDYDAANAELRAELAKHYPNGAKLCDPFSGRAMIPLEAARLGVQAWGIDYSPVATLAGRLLADYPMRNWDDEPPLPFESYESHAAEHFTEPRLLRDVRFMLDEVGRRYESAMGEFYPMVDGKRPWGYVWAVTLPCANCGNRFPLTGSLALRNPNPKKDDPGQSYRIVADAATGTFAAEVHVGQPDGPPTLVKAPGRRGKSGVCCFCGQVHPLDTLKRMMRDGLGLNPPIGCWWARVSRVGESHWLCWRLLILDTRMESCHMRCRLGSRRRVGTARRRPSVLCVRCVSCVRSWAPITGRRGGSRPSWGSGWSRCGRGSGRPRSMLGCALVRAASRLSGSRRWRPRSGSCVGRTRSWARRRLFSRKGLDRPLR